MEDYENQMKGKLKSYLSCIPDMISFDIKVNTDEFIILSTDGVFESMDIFQVVTQPSPRQISSWRDTINCNFSKIPTKSSAVSSNTAKSSPLNATTWLSSYSSSEKDNSNNDPFIGTMSL